MIDDRIRKIVIVGGGTAGWMAAAALARVLGSAPGLEIVLIESDEIGTVGVGESTIPQIQLFNSMLGIDEGDFVRETNATYKLGIEFVDWTRLGERFVHPFGFYGLDMMGIEFHHFWLKGRQLGDATPLNDYSLAIVAGLAGRFAHPRPDLPNSPLSKISYAFQFDAGLYARMLRRRAEAAGVARIEGRIVAVKKSSEPERIDSVELRSGEQVQGDLFIDCSGFRGLLIEQEMQSGYEDWTHWLPCDRAVAVGCENGGDRLPLTRATAREAGWQWRIPLQHRIGNGYVYSSEYVSDDEASAALLSRLDGAPLGEPRMLRFTAGHRKRQWIGNIVSIGLAAGFLEPLESTSIHLVQVAIAKLLAYFPTLRFDEGEIGRFNAEMAQEFVDIRDFLVLHYIATQRTDTPFWRRCRTLTPPPGVQQKLDMFRTNGRIFREHNEIFTETSWLAVLTGKGIEPRGYHPVADLLSDQETLERLQNIRSVVRDTADAMLPQDEWLDQIRAQGRTA